MAGGGVASNFDPRKVDLNELLEGFRERNDRDVMITPRGRSGVQETTCLEARVLYTHRWVTADRTTTPLVRSEHDDPPSHEEPCRETPLEHSRFRQ